MEAPDPVEIERKKEEARKEAAKKLSDEADESNNKKEILPYSSMFIFGTENM